MRCWGGKKSEGMNNSSDMRAALVTVNWKQMAFADFHSPLLSILFQSSPKTDSAVVLSDPRPNTSPHMPCGRVWIAGADSFLHFPSFFSGCERKRCCFMLMQGVSFFGS